MTEAEALKRFIPILGRISTPGDRVTITRNILERIAGQQTCIMGISHKHAGALAWPSDPMKAIAFEQALNMAVDTGDFASLLHRVDRRHFQIEELAAWPNCPKVDTDSPLIFWLGDGFIEAPAQNTASPAPVAHTPDPERRLSLLRELGGSAKYARAEWTFKGMAALVASEKANGFKRCDEKTIRADLKEAAQAEREAKSAGIFNGLGQR